MAFSVGSLRRTAATTVFTAAIVISPFLSTIAQAVNITGGGATFPELLYGEYIKEYQKANPSDKVSYQAIGSGGGIRATIAGTYDFGASDAAMTDAQLGQGAAGKRGIILVPTAGGAVVPVFNLPGVAKLNLSRESLAGVFSGRITKWNDPKIVKDNPGVSLPDTKVNVVVRSDGSGTTFVWTNHLSAIDAYFKGRVGVGTAPQWTNDPLKGRGNSGVAATVQKTKNSIGYVEFSFAKKNNIPIAGVQDAAGQFVQPSLEGTNQALAAIKFPPNFRVFDGNPKSGYPITGLTWMMVYRKYPDQAKADAVKNWIRWVLKDGQNVNTQQGFAKIPPETAQLVLQELDTVTVGQ
jgi:phosphate transport system substrate-binding protein